MRISKTKRRAKGPTSYQPTAQGKAVMKIGGLKVRSKSLGERLVEPGLQPLVSVGTVTWAVGPGWHGAGPLALSRTFCSP